MIAVLSLNILIHLTENQINVVNNIVRLLI